MKFTKVRLTAGATVIDLPVQGALPTDPYQLRGLDGVTTQGKNVYISATQEGGYYSGSKPLTLQPVIKIGLNPNWSIGQDVSDLRTALYALLVQEDTPVILSFMNAAVEVCRVTGYVSKFESVPFSKDTIVGITLDSTDTYLQAPTQTQLLPGSGLTNGGGASFTNPGSAKSGFIAEFVFAAAAAGGVMLKNSLGRSISITGSYAIGDKITINTIYGQRSAILTKTGTGVVSSLLPFLTVSPDWPNVIPGLNTFTVRNAVDNANDNVTWNYLKYTPQYWGI